MTGTVIPPATTFTEMFVGDVIGAAGGTEVLRVKLMTPDMEPAVGVTVSAPVETVVETVAVYVPDPERITLPVWPHPTARVDGVIVKDVGGVTGGASLVGPSTPTTADDSIARFCASVTMILAVPQPFSVTRYLPPFVVTTDGVTARNCGDGDTTLYGGVPP